MSIASLFLNHILQNFLNYINGIKTIHWGIIVSNVDILTDVPYSNGKINLRNRFVCNFPLVSLYGLAVFFYPVWKEADVKIKIIGKEYS